jgi:putative membrane protein
LAVAVVVSAAGSPAAVVGRVAAAPPEAGDELAMEFSKRDHEVVSAAIREAEKHTCGQVVCVLSHSSSEYAYVPILWASVLALLVPWPSIDFTQWTVQRIFLLQLVVFISVGMLFWWTPLRFALVPRAIQRARAHRAALEQFVIRRVANTRNRCGILIFVSMAEHYARVIADEGIAQKVHQTQWQAAIDTLVGHIRDDRIAAGFVAAIEHCGAVLAMHAPPDGSRDELPDRLYVV